MSSAKKNSISEEEKETKEEKKEPVKRTRVSTRPIKKKDQEEKKEQPIKKSSVKIRFVGERKEKKEDEKKDSKHEESRKKELEHHKHIHHKAAHHHAEPKKEKNKPKSISLYRKISFSFIFLTVILIAVVFYFLAVGVTISVSPKKERISDKLIFTIYNDAKKDTDFTSREYIKGVVEQIQVKEEKTYQSAGAKVIGKEIIGKVKIINNHNQSQALIASTRLLTADQKLFRIKNDVNIKAGGSMEVEIYSDEPSEDLAIGPSEFTIPGLWAGLQDKIYAKSDSAFVFKTQVKRYIDQADIDKSIQDLRGILVKKAEESFSQGYKGYDKIIYEIDKNSIEIEVGAKVGDEIEEFKISISAKVNIVGLKKSEIEKVAQEKLVSAIPNNKKLIEFNGDKIEYNLGNYNFEVGVATIDVSFSGTMSANEADDLINKEKIIGLTEAQLKDYLINLDKFENFEIVFSPSFIKKVPSLVDKIKIKVKK